MICQACGNRPAVVHLEELRNGARFHLWLCVECAAERKAAREGSEAAPGLPGFPGSGEDPAGGEPSFAGFLGRMFRPREGTPAEAAACPACGFSMDQLGRTSRLGCPNCYDFFRPVLLPLLGRLHRHSSHLGKIPWRSGNTLSPEREIARHRVALEKAIVAENFEEAARLRDLIGRLEGISGVGQAGPEDPSGGGDSS